MKFLTQFSRVLVGVLFVLSGIIKLNDPTGFSYKLDEYFSVFASDFEAKQDSLKLSIQLEKQVVAEKKEGSNESVILTTQVEEQLDLEVLPSDQVWDLSTRISTWVPRTDDTAIFEATIYVSVNGADVFESNIVGDSSSKCGNLVASARLGNNNVGDKFDFGVYGNYAPEFKDNGSVSLDFSEFKVADGFMAGFFESLKPHAVALAIFVSLLESIIGFALLIGWQSLFTAIMLFLISAFFTFLTWYSWVYDKVTDCGCFGDAMPMTPYESFLKNIVLGVFVLIILFGHKYIRPIFSNPFGVKLLTSLAILMVAFSLYCKHYLPMMDFLKFKEGNNICELMQVPEGERVSPWKITTYKYLDADGKEVLVVFDSDNNTFTPKMGAGWKYVEVVSEEVKAEAYEPPIHDFRVLNAEQSNDYIEDFFATDQKLLAVMHDLSKTNVASLKKLKELAKAWKESGKEFWALTSSSAEEAEAFRHEHQLNFEFYFGDNTNLKSIIRSNPGLLLITDTCVVKKVWPSTRLPKFEQVEKKLK
jgi:uncharacterized membrane protein YphA (DoxX/SURF4 family)